MDWLEIILDYFQYPYIQRAFGASAMVGIMCGILGCFIVLRNMSLIGDALSHAILPGVVVGFVIMGQSLFGLFMGSVGAGLLAAIFITLIQRNVPTKDDAAIGIVYTAFFALGVMGISKLTRQEGVHLDLKDFLFGDVLGISNYDLWMTFLIMVFVIICVLAFYRFFFITTFESVVAQTLGISVRTMHYFLMLLLSFAVVASLQSVGVILVVAMLITPASTAYLLTQNFKRMIIYSALIGLCSTSLGLIFAILAGTTPGPAMTVCATLIYLIGVVFAPKTGLFSKYLIRRKRQTQILLEDILKQSVRLEEQKNFSLDQLTERLGISLIRLKHYLKRLGRQGLYEKEGTDWRLSYQGQIKGYQLVRAHRLWETYLVEEMGLGLNQIHENAEKYEHILSEELLDEVAQKLGNPQKDPHGSPIPPSKKRSSK